MLAWGQVTDNRLYRPLQNRGGTVQLKSTLIILSEHPVSPSLRVSYKTRIVCRGSSERFTAAATGWAKKREAAVHDRIFVANLHACHSFVPQTHWGEALFDGGVFKGDAPILPAQ